MIVGSVQKLDVNVHACGITQGIEEFTRHLGIILSDPRRCEFYVEIQIRASGKIDRAKHQCFIHRDDGGAETLHGSLVPHCV